MKCFQPFSVNQSGRLEGLISDPQVVAVVTVPEPEHVAVLPLEQFEVPTKPVVSIGAKGVNLSGWVASKVALLVQVPELVQIKLLAGLDVLVQLPAPVQEQTAPPPETHAPRSSGEEKLLVEV